jgi:hypothetical protein
MRVRVVVELDVGDTPVADAITHHIARHGLAPADDEGTPEAWVEGVLLDALQRVSSGCGGQMLGWRVVSSRSERASN